MRFSYHPALDLALIVTGINSSPMFNTILLFFSLYSTHESESKDR